MNKKHLFFANLIVNTVIALVLVGLYLTSLYSYLLFHALVELVTMIIAGGIFVLAWNTQRFSDNDYLLFIGLSYLFVIIIDLLHTLAYKGMGVFQGYDSNLPTQLWIAARYVQGISLLIAPFFIRRKLNPVFILAGYVLVTVLLLMSIFYWQVFPACYIEGIGLTPFKKISEYVISLILLAAIVVLLHNRKEFDRRVFRWLVSSFLLTIGAELAFTFYVSVYGFSNLIGHFFKLMAFYFIYKAIIETNLRRPYDFVFRNLTQSKELLQQAHGELEFRVHERTMELAKANEALQADITERKQAELQLSLQSSALSAAANAIVITDRDGSIQWINPAWTELTGYALEEVRGQNPRLLKSGVQDEAFYKNMWDTILDGKVWHNELVNKRKDGSLYTEEETITPLLDEQGQIAHFIGIKQDITEHKQAEEALQEAEARYRALVEQIPAIVYTDSAEQKGQTLYISPQIKIILGYDPEEWMADNDLWIKMMHPDDRERVSAEYVHAYEMSKPFNVEYRMIARDGRVVWMRDEAVLMRGQSGNPLFWQGILLDITERKRAEEQLAEYSEHLEEMVEARTRELRAAQEQLVRQERLATLGQLAGSIGHELRNPLGVISNAVYFLKMSQPDADDRVNEYLDIIENETHTSDKIITDLLEFTRIKPVDREPVAVSEMVRQTLERFPTPESVEVKLEIAPDLPLVYADPHNVVQVLGNLTVNACQSMNNVGKLIISANVHGDMIGIAVRDTGTGISPENLSKLFEPLFTTKVKGIGLGLAVSKKLIEANSGRIEVQSKLGKGSTFSVYLPVYNLE